VDSVAQLECAGRRAGHCAEHHAARPVRTGLRHAVSNPKAWAFMMALLPPFIDPTVPLAPQMTVLLALMIVIEFTCLLIYAQGGRSLSELLLSGARHSG